VRGRVIIDGLMRATSVRQADWRAPWLWRVLLRLAPPVVALVARLRVSGDVPAGLRGGPLILAANHVSPVDPVVMTAVCRRLRVPARFMATGGLFRAPVVGWVMRASGHIRVDRRTAEVARALPAAAQALVEGSAVLVYPEGRIGLDPRMWPERGKTGTARLALTTGATVVPVAQWGAHEVLPYTSPRGLAGSVWRAVRRRPRVSVRVGAPVDLSGLDPSAPGDAVRATERIMAAIAETLVPLRVDEPDMPRFVDRTRPVDESRLRPAPPMPPTPPAPPITA
jgi:1-acyl-sn-glycerol-3-phosphate acyltransferase